MYMYVCLGHAIATSAADRAIQNVGMTSVKSEKEINPKF